MLTCKIVKGSTNAEQISLHRHPSYRHRANVRLLQTSPAVELEAIQNPRIYVAFSSLMAPSTYMQLSCAVATLVKGTGTSPTLLQRQQPTQNFKVP